MLSFILQISSPDGALQLQSSRLQPLSSLPTYVAIYRKQSESLLSSIQLKRSHEESVQEGFRFNLTSTEQSWFRPLPTKLRRFQILRISASLPPSETAQGLGLCPHHLVLMGLVLPSSKVQNSSLAVPK